MKKILLITTLLLVLLSGCEKYGWDNTTPNAVNNAPRPLTIKTINSKGLILMDGDGVLHSYPASYYFVQVLLESNSKAGDILAKAEGRE